MAAAKEVAVRVVADERGESSEWNQDSNLCRENANRWKRSIGSHFQISSKTIEMFCFGETPL